MKRKNLYSIILISALSLSGMVSCKKYLDIVPDNVATIENAFTMRKEAEKFLFTCYSYLPSNGSVNNPAFSAGDELSVIWPFVANSMQPPAYNIARGLQNKVNPYINYWDGSQSGKALYDGLRDVNIFLENIGKVPDLHPDDKKRWIAEAKFIKAYLHFYLLRLYGPIPLIKENLPIDVEPEKTKTYRDPVDSCFNYIVQLLDEAKFDLPLELVNTTDELGRITTPICVALKAKVLVTAASPLFNGNTDYAFYKDNRGVQLFSQVKDDAKWTKAVEACKEAVEICHEVGHQLYVFKQSLSQNLAQPTLVQMSIRNSLADKWNTEVIWGNTNSMTSNLQSNSIPRGLDDRALDNTAPRGQLSPPLKIVEMFYTKNGVPINEDRTFDYGNRYSLRIGTSTEKYNIEEGYTTAYLNFDRENRFYASLGFDGGKWYGQGKMDDNNTHTLRLKRGQASAPQVNFAYSTTGYFVKKLTHFENTINAGAGTVTIKDYPWPEMRLADLYLLYAEALNEKNGPTADALHWINEVRIRAGIPTVENAWTNFAKNPAAYQTKEGLRRIIHRERYIELAFEGQRWYDMLRWKEAIEQLNMPVTGWDINQADATAYYRPKPIFNQTFTLKDYFQPVLDRNITVNKNLLQSPGW